MLTSALRRAFAEDVLHELTVLPQVRALSLHHVLELVFIPQLQVGEVRLFVLSLLVSVSLHSAHEHIHLGNVLSLHFV